EAVALCAAAGWMYCGAMAFFVLWSLGSSWALFPLVLFATRRCVHAPGWRSMAILATALTLLLLAGHPETAFHIVFCGALYGGVELVAVRRDVGRVLISAAAAGAIALLLSAIYLLPMFEAAPQTMEHQFRTGGYRDVPRGVPLAESGARILTDVFPHLHGRWWMRKVPHWVPLETSSTGSIILAIAVYALFRVRRRETAFFGALALFGILCNADWSPLAALMQKLPLFDITLNERFSFAAAMSLVILAALGIEHALRTRDKTLGYTLAAATLIFAAGAFTINYLHVMEDKLPEWGVYTLFGELVGLGIAAMVGLAVSRSRGLAVDGLPGCPVAGLPVDATAGEPTNGPTEPRETAQPRDPATPAATWQPGNLIAATLLLLLTTQRWLAGHDIYPTLPAFAAYPPIPILKAIPRGSAEPFRIVGRAHALVPGTSALYELEDVRGYEAMTLSRYVATYEAWCKHQPVWFNRVDDLTKPFLSMLNVRYAIASENIPAPDGWKQIAVQRGAELLENTRVFPRAFVPSHVVFGTHFDEMIKAITAATDFHERAWIEAPLETGERGNDGTVASVKYDSGDLLIDAATGAGAWVVITEPAWDGWRVYIDDRRVEHFYANAAFIGVFVPAGGHRIRLTYLPQSFVRGRAISLGTLAILLGGGIAIRIRRRGVVTRT
ncbi:MAG: hypothetical protein QOE82_3011, partial [Thermoanaerobaculia bacterium]|nr:hypothetical protein [Thermoanaerobaculia bacterium]